MAADPVKSLIKYASAYSVQDILAPYLNDVRLPNWSGSGSPEKHHYGRGQLAVHTLEVVELSLLNNGYFAEPKRVDPRLVVLAATAHDWGKLWDYKPVNADAVDWNDFEPDDAYKDWVKTSHCTDIHHVSRSAIEFTVAAKGKLPQEEIDQVVHAILSHHGRKEWGSPVTPSSPLAWLVHLSDGISARMDDCLKPKP